MTVLPEFGKVGLYAIQIVPGIVKFGRTESCLTRRIMHHNNNVRGLGIVEFQYAWVEHAWPRKAERDLKRRLKIAGFEPGATLESFQIGWDAAERMQASLALEQQRQSAAKAEADRIAAERAADAETARKRLAAQRAAETRAANAAAKAVRIKQGRD